MKTLQGIAWLIFFCILSMLGAQFLSAVQLPISDIKMRWIHQQIYDKPKQDIDYLIIGGSRVWCGLKPKIITDKTGKTVWNFGRNWMGRDTDYFILKHAIEEHRVHQVIIEVTELESDPGYAKPHNYMKFILRPTEIPEELGMLKDGFTGKEILFYSGIFKENLLTLIEYVAEASTRTPRVLTQSMVRKIKPDASQLKDLAAYDETLGFNINDESYTQQEDFRQKFANTKFNPVFNRERIPDRSMYYLRKIEKLAKENNVRVSFVFMGQYKPILPALDVFKYHNQLGDFYLVDSSILFNLDYWRNMTHLFHEGATKMTELLIPLLENGEKSSPVYTLYTNEIKKQNPF